MEVQSRRQPRQQRHESKEPNRLGTWAEWARRIRTQGVDPEEVESELLAAQVARAFEGAPQRATLSAEEAARWAEIEAAVRALTFARNLRQRRLAAGLSSTELARVAGVHRTYINKLERGQHAPPSTRMVQRLAWALGVGPDDLLGEPGQPAQGPPEGPHPADPLARRMAQAAQALWSVHGFLLLRVGTGRRRVAELSVELLDRLERDSEEVQAGRMEAVAWAIRLPAERVREAVEAVRRLGSPEKR